MSTLNPGADRPADAQLQSRPPNIVLVHPGRSAYAPQPVPRAKAHLRVQSNETKAIIVAVLTLACTALAIFDLLLLASGAY